MRSEEEIDRQIEGLEDMKEWLPEVSTFGSPNWEIIDAQMLILSSEMFLEDFPEGDWDNMDAENEIYRAAQEAEDWLYGAHDEDLFEER